MEYLMSAIGEYLTDKEVLVILGARFRARRLDRNLSINALSEKTGLNFKTIIGVESGADVKFSSIIKVTRALGMVGSFEALLPDTLPGNESFSSRGTLRLRAYKTQRRKG
jgi:transcriptional regulator with XRE-family HTH domain